MTKCVSGAVCPQQHTKQAEASLTSGGKVKRKCIMSLTVCVCDESASPSVHRNLSLLLHLCFKHSRSLALTSQTNFEKTRLSDTQHRTEAKEKVKGGAEMDERDGGGQRKGLFFCNISDQPAEKAF